MKSPLLRHHDRDRTRRTAPSVGSAANISFTGEVHDDETGLDAYKFRSYNPQLGRWMSPDPSSLRFANLAVPQTFNLYAYVTNDPLKYIDADGLLEEDSTDPSTQLVSADGTNQDGGGPAGSDGATMTILYSPDGGSTVGGEGGGGGGAGGGGSSGSTSAPPISTTDSVTVTAAPDPAQPLTIDPIQTSPNAPGIPPIPPPDLPVPVHGLWTYGNYCGAGGTGTPINAVDQACAVHDSCFASSGADWTNMQNNATWGLLNSSQQAQVQGCNQQLCNAMNAAWPQIPAWNINEQNAALEIYWFFQLLVPKGAQCHL